MNDLIVHTINIAHDRLIELTKLADQAKPFYDWVEKQAKRITGSNRCLNEILLSCSKLEIEKIIKPCYQAGNDEKPLLFDGIGRVYPHSKACFYFFAWMIRDAPQQRLSPLISRMQKADNELTKIIAETDSLVELIFEYRTIVKSFEWSAVREVVIDRLEGSRRSISGHRLEANIRTSLITAIQYYYSIYGNYGKFKNIEIADKQIKLGKHTIDVSAELTPKDGTHNVSLLIPVKTRETEGGGHSHLFTRDLITAISELKNANTNSRIVVIIIAENWSASEIVTITNQIDIIFHFNMNPNKFVGFDEKSQVKFNKYLEKILEGEQK
ncbi:NheIR [Planktothrix tepida]|uniref:NheIR n=1 Tax=Planktothrix tepida PCC 9214 TaxID=671072 RepID=A0A1J1LQN4_9CYAN|nr:hypothetical protein [Planktothrix tepida]CAD5963603.1 NheIR [Planktothrix tepida]CUR34896.1 NheIR [Planktothrix tepida PCC 9214]